MFFKSKCSVLVALMFAMIFTTSGCVGKDGIDFAYEAYQKQKSRCMSSPDISQRDACMHVAAEQMFGSVENHLSQFGPVEEQGNLMQMKIRKDEDINKKRVELPPPPPYIPSIPQAGPTIESLSVPDDNDDMSEDESSEGEKTEETQSADSSQEKAEEIPVEK